MRESAWKRDYFEVEGCFSPAISPSRVLTKSRALTLRIVIGASSLRLRLASVLSLTTSLTMAPATRSGGARPGKDAEQKIQQTLDTDGNVKKPKKGRGSGDSMLGEPPFE